MSRWWKRMIGDWWKPLRCAWPYPEGWATYNEYRHMIADSGLTLEQARKICRELNV